MIHNNSGLIVLFLVVILAWIAFVDRFNGPWWSLVILCVVIEVGLIFGIRHITNKIAGEF